MEYEELKELSVLFVDDEAEIRENIQAILAPFFGAFYVAQDGIEALEMLKRHPIDILITDISMPRMDGIELAKRVEQPVIFVTAFSDSESILQTIELGAVGYLLKPIDVEALLEVVLRAKAILDAKKHTQKLEAQVEFLAYHDMLTKLPNHNALIEGDFATIFVVDINGFKNYNTIYGTAFGNEILVRFAKRLEAFARNYDATAFRLCADSFAVGCHMQLAKEECALRAKELIQAIAQPMEINGKRVTIEVTIGVASGVENLLEAAELALDKAMEQKESCYMYEEGLKQASRGYLEVIEVISSAIREDGVVPFLQPIEGGGYSEVLMRLRHGERYYSPSYFMEIAKRARLYRPLSRALLKKAFAIAKKERVSINITYEDILHAKTQELILDGLRENGHNVIVEVTESEAIEDFELVRSFLREVKRLGAGVAIDDFGSGYSNFIYVIEMEPDYLKIDGTLIQRIEEKEVEALIRSIVAFSRMMRIELVAEYVSSATIYERCRRLGIKKYQGFYFQAPKAAYETHT